MQKRKIGSSEIFVSAMGLGTVKFGRNTQVKYPCKFELPSDQDLTKLLKETYSLGINFLDTAPAYGTSEERIGKLLKGWRKSWVLSTKAGEEFKGGKSIYNFTAEAIEKSVLQSLKKLQTDYLDIVLLHSNGKDEEKILEGLDCLKKLKEKGLIRIYGMSSKTIRGGLSALKKSDLAMIHYNQEYCEEEEIIQLAQKEKKGILIKKAFQNGYLAAVKDEAEKKEILRNNIDFILKNPAVSSIIIGTVDLKHLQENVSFF